MPFTKNTANAAVRTRRDCSLVLRYARAPSPVGSTEATSAVRDTFSTVAVLSQANTSECGPEATVTEASAVAQPADSSSLVSSVRGGEVPLISTGTARRESDRSYVHPRIAMSTFTSMGDRSRSPAILANRVTDPSMIVTLSERLDTEYRTSLSPSSVRTSDCRTFAESIEMSCRLHSFHSPFSWYTSRIRRNSSWYERVFAPVAFGQ